MLDLDSYLLKEGRWIVRTGTNIPLSHSAWFPCQPQTLRQHNLSNGSVADLIDSTTHTWKPGLVRLLYPYPTSSEILRLPISKTGSGLDQSDYFKDYCIHTLLLRVNTKWSMPTIWFPRTMCSTPWINGIWYGKSKCLWEQQTLCGDFAMTVCLLSLFEN